eukprot:4340103-Amphidinium_carterae.1
MSIVATVQVSVGEPISIIGADIFLLETQLRVVMSDWTHDSFTVPNGAKTLTAQLQLDGPCQRLVVWGSRVQLSEQRAAPKGIEHKGISPKPDTMMLFFFVKSHEEKSLKAENQNPEVNHFGRNLII